MSELPSMEEFKTKNTTNTIQFDEHVVNSLPLFECPKCGGNVYRDMSIVYMTNPPKYKYFCKDCGSVHIF